MDISPGGYSEFFPIHRLGLFLGGQVSNFGLVFFLDSQKKNEYFKGRHFCGYFLGGPIKTEYFLVFSVGKRVILVFFSNFRYFLGYAKTS